LLLLVSKDLHFSCKWRNKVSRINQAHWPTYIPRRVGHCDQTYPAECLCYQLVCSRSAQIRLYMTTRWNILHSVRSYVLIPRDLQLLYATRMYIVRGTSTCIL